MSSGPSCSKLMTLLVNVALQKLFSFFQEKIAGYLVRVERCHGRVVRAAWLWCRKSPYRVSSRLSFAMRRLKNCLYQPNSKWVPFSNKGRIRQRKARDGLRLSSAMPRYSGTLTPTAPTAIGNLYLYYYLVRKS